MIRQPAGLRTFAAIGAALAERFAGEALTGVGDAESAVDKSFQFNRRFTKLGELPERNFAGDDDALDAQPLRKRDPFRRGDGHLRRGMNFHPQPEFLGQHSQTQILNQHRVHTGRIECDELALGDWQLVGENQHIERGVPAHIVGMEKFHQRGQLVVGKIISALPGIELLETEIDRICAVGNRGSGAVPVTRGGEEFRFHAATT